MLNHVYSNSPELYNYTHCAYGKPCYLFYGSSVITSEDGTQQGDPEYANCLNASAEKTLPRMFVMVFLASKVQGDSLGIET